MQPINPQYPGAVPPGTPMQPQYPAPGTPGVAPGQAYQPGQSYPAGQSYPGQGYPVGQGYQPGYGPPVAQRAPVDLSRIGAAVTAFCGLIVLFASLASLYHVKVTPSAAPDAHDVDSGTVDVKMGFFSVVPFNAPIVALAIPMLMLVAALTAVPALLGRGGQERLVSAVSACAAALLAFVLTLSDPLPSVGLSGDLASSFSKETGTSLDNYVDTVVSVTPGTGLIISVIFGLVGAAGAVLAYLRAAPQPG